MKKTFLFFLIISISISLILYFCLINISQFVFGAVRCNYSTLITSDTYKEEKRLNPPLPPMQIEFLTQPSLPSEKEIIKMQKRIKKINEPLDIPITNATILGPNYRSEIDTNITIKINDTESFDKKKISPSTIVSLTSGKSKKPSLIVTENKTLTNIANTIAVVETSLANKNDTIFYTGNFLAARSFDGGKTWSSVNPVNYFSNLQGDYCFNLEGDQDVIYDPIHDIFLWYMQGSVYKGNYIRIGVSSDSYEWNFYTFNLGDIIKDGNIYRADYPALSLSKEYLYITTNVEPNGTSYTKYPIIIRISLDDLAKRIGPSFDYYSDPLLPSNTSTFTPVQGYIYKMDRMYWGILVGNEKIKIYEWLDSLPPSSVKSYERKIPPWTPINKKEKSEQGECHGPDMRNWCSKGASKIRGGFIANDVLGFFWDANKGGGNGSYSTYNGTFQYPYINAATFNISDNMTYMGRPYLWSPTFAWMYPFTSPDSQGNVVIQAFFGGGTKFYPNIAVGVGNDFTESSLPWKMKRLVNSTDGPRPNNWGDYLRVRPFNGEGPGWIGSGWTLQGGQTEKFLVLHYFEFTLDNNSSRSLEKR